MKYAIIDLETTGGNAKLNRITEVGIVIIKNGEIIDTFESLVNPEISIPQFITGITGITNSMVQDAPKFYEIARKIVEITEGCIFVAHNVKFDYSFLKKEFENLGYSYNRKTLDTVRLTRKVNPGLQSYGLSNLIKVYNLTINGRHRAMGDAMATAELFNILMQSEKMHEAMSTELKLGIKESNLPLAISMTDILSLPEECGVYYMYNNLGQVIYVGKSKNIQKRIIQHFKANSEKARKLFNLVHQIDYEITGSELLALLKEALEIKIILPEINKALKRTNFPAVIHSYMKGGYLRIEAIKVNKSIKHTLNIVDEFSKEAAAKNKLWQAVEKFNLCPTLTGLERDRPCFWHQIKKCNGACLNKESTVEYNQRVNLALKELSRPLIGSFAMMETGFNGEVATVVVLNGKVAGYCVLDESEPITEDTILDALIDVESDRDINRIVSGYLHAHKNKLQIIEIDQI